MDMDLIANLATGFGVAFTPINLLYAFVGCMLGTLIGVLPGIGPVATIAMLLPGTFALPPVSALIMLAGIYYGAQYGGSTTAILINVPGESSSVVTAIDGYQMARRGRAGAALAAAGQQLSNIGQQQFTQGLGAAQQTGALGEAAQNAALQGAQAQVGAGTLQQQTEREGGV